MARSLGILRPVIAVALVLALSSSALALSPSYPIAKRFFPTISWATQHASALAGPASGGSANLVYNGGNILKAPAVYLVFWGWNTTGPTSSLYDPSGEARYLINFFAGIGGTSYAGIQTQYSSTSQGSITNPASQLAGVWWDNADPLPEPSVTTGLGLRSGSGTIVLGDDVPMQLEAKAAATHFGYNPSGIYMILTPTHFNDPLFGAVYCGWHSTTNPALTGNPIAFADVGYSTDAPLGTCGENFVNAGAKGLLDGASMVAGHEYAEAVTDPVVGTGWVDSSGSENGDKCAWDQGPGAHAQNLAWSTGTFAVQSLWSNAASGCAIKYP